MENGIVNGIVNKQQKKILVHVVQRKYRGTELVKILGIPDRTLKRHIALPVDYGLIVFDGPYKTGGYIPTAAFIEALNQYPIPVFTSWYTLIGSRDPINGPINGPIKKRQLSDNQINTKRTPIFGPLSGTINGLLTDMLNAGDITVIRLLHKGTYNTAQLANQRLKPVTKVKNTCVI